MTLENSMNLIPTDFNIFWWLLRFEMAGCNWCTIKVILMMFICENNYASTLITIYYLDRYGKGSVGGGGGWEDGGNGYTFSLFGCFKNG